MNIPNPVLTIGTFDGVHLGHQKIIKQLNKIAEEVGGESVLFTFYPHPRMVLFPDDKELKLLQTQVEKLEKLERIGLQNIVVFPFTKRFSRLTATAFVRDYLVNKLNVKTIVIGYDHQFGKNREGTLTLLKELAPIYDFEVIEIKAQDIDDVNISSTKIRKALQAGDTDTAYKFLGEPYEITGTVIQGEKIGRSINYPTANLNLESDLKLVPKLGAYAVRVVLENKTEHFGMLNIGYRPTLENDGKLSIEVHLLNFKGNLYDQQLTVKLLHFIRDEQKFDTLNALKVQIEKDETMVRNMVAEHSW